MMKPTLQLRIGQQLTMTPQLQQAIRLLQLPALELQAQVREALASNVMLEADEGFEPEPAPDAAPDPLPGDAENPEPVVEIGDEWTEPTAAESEAPRSPSAGGVPEVADESGRSLQDHLNWQLEMARLPPAARAIGRALVDAINDDGYLVETLEEIADAVAPEISAAAPDVESVLAVIQQFDPAGVGARSVAECIELQLRQLDGDTPGRAAAIELTRHHLEQVAAQRFAELRRALQCSGEELAVALALVRGCHPRPGSTFQATRTEFVIPDVFVRRSPQGWTVELNPSAAPRVRLNETYAALITRAPDHAALRAQLQEARWLLHSLEIRGNTILRVARSIVERQSAFLDHGDEAMVPMILRDVAQAVELHESTVSRVTTGKYLHTPRGVFEFRHFFSSQVPGEAGTGVSSTAIRARIRRLVAAESPAKPLSDHQIVERLAADGILIARRTVAKYRETLGIPPAAERRHAAAR